jgi:hypothetical protein
LVLAILHIANLKEAIAEMKDLGSLRSEKWGVYCERNGSV